MKKWIFLIAGVVGLGALSFADQTREVLDRLVFKKDYEGLDLVVTNDGVMGGLSQGKVSQTEAGDLLFSGTLSLQNNGGFSLLEINETPLDFAGAKGVKLKVKGDGRDYKVRFRTDEKYRFSRVGFDATFSTVAGEWAMVEVPFSALKASWRGRALDREFDSKKVERMGIMLADKKEGAFRLEVAMIEPWRD